MNITTFILPVSLLLISNTSSANDMCPEGNTVLFSAAVMHDGDSYSRLCESPDGSIVNYYGSNSPDASPDSISALLLIDPIDNNKIQTKQTNKNNQRALVVSYSYGGTDYKITQEESSEGKKTELLFSRDGKWKKSNQKPIVQSTVLLNAERLIELGTK